MNDEIYEFSPWTFDDGTIDIGLHVIGDDDEEIEHDIWVD